ncbi:MAG TPA: hypothetical protein VHO06_24085 [Polyangia bacterium]|nr:hypothetical protein [Polyangia bacterium]
MNLRDRIWTALALAFALAAGGCGSSGAAKGEGGVLGCQPILGGGGTMSWVDDGTQACATSAVATFEDTSLSTLFNLVAATTTVGIDFSVSTVLGPAAIGGSYSCVPLDSLSVTFDYTQAKTSTAATSCGFMLNMQGTAGVHATGTFSATLTLTGGATKSITDGAFDVPVTIVVGT